MKTFSARAPTSRSLSTVVSMWPPDSTRTRATGTRRVLAVLDNSADVRRRRQQEGEPVRASGRIVVPEGKVLTGVMRGAIVIEALRRAV
jgi:hypothetical protein